MSRVKREGFTGTPPTNPDEVNQTQVNQIEVDETERQRLTAAFWEIYNKNVIDRKVLCDHIYGILLALMQNPVLMESPGDRFYVLQKMVFFTITSDSNEPNPTVWVPVKTNANFEERLQLLKQELQTGPGNLERQKQRLAVESGLYDLAVEKILPLVQSFPKHTRARELFLQPFNDLQEYLQRSQEELQQKLPENQGQVVKKAELAKEIGDSLLDEIKKRSSTRKVKELAEKIGGLLSRLKNKAKNST